MEWLELTVGGREGGVSVSGGFDVKQNGGGGEAE